MRLRTLLLSALFIATISVFAQQTDDPKETRLVQVSFIPNLGTPNYPADRFVNNISLNVIAGYQGGVKGVELGGFANIDNGDVLGAQGAGFVNVVRGGLTGVQAAGFANYLEGPSKGVQYAGFVNFHKSHITGLQSAGFVNYTSSVTGLQGAGFVNVTLEDSKGAQGAGFVNANLADYKGFQGAGFVNLTKELHGVQTAGFVNVARDTKGAQFSGFGNAARDMNGAQVSGFLNLARKVNGVQIGFVNVADTVEKGATIGILNIVRHGMHRWEIDHNDITDINASFRGGTERFYSIISSGFKTGDNAYWSTGVGFGTMKTFKNNLYANIEMSANSIHPKDEPFENLNLVNKINPNIGYQITPFLSINGGPVLNLYYTSAEDGQSVLGPNPRKPFYDETVNDTNLRMWMGYRVALRF